MKEKTKSKKEREKKREIPNLSIVVPSQDTKEVVDLENEAELSPVFGNDQEIEPGLKHLPYDYEYKAFLKNYQIFVQKLDMVMSSSDKEIVNFRNKSEDSEIMGLIVYKMFKGRKDYELIIKLIIYHFEEVQQERLDKCTIEKIKDDYQRNRLKFILNRCNNRCKNFKKLKLMIESE